MEKKRVLKNVGIGILLLILISVIVLMLWKLPYWDKKLHYSGEVSGTEKTKGSGLFFSPKEREYDFQVSLQVDEGVASIYIYQVNPSDVSPQNEQEIEEEMKLVEVVEVDKTDVVDIDLASYDSNWDYYVMIQNDVNSDAKYSYTMKFDEYVTRRNNIKHNIKSKMANLFKK